MFKTTLTSIICSSLLFFVFQSAAMAGAYIGVYKWVDKNGVVHYGQQPGSSDAEQVRVRTDETVNTRKINLDSDKDKDGGSGQAEKQPAKPAEPKISKKEKRRLCEEARHDITAINSRGRMREINEKGEYIYLPDEEKQKRLKAAQIKQRKYCR